MIAVPGWPKKLTEYVKLSVEPLLKAFSVRCLDIHNEDTDVMEGQCFVVTATDAAHCPIRMRQTPQNPWSECAIYQIREFVPGKFGALVDLSYDSFLARQHELDIKVALYGFTPERASIFKATPV